MGDPWLENSPWFGEKMAKAQAKGFVEGFAENFAAGFAKSFVEDFAESFAEYVVEIILEFLGRMLVHIVDKRFLCLFEAAQTRAAEVEFVETMCSLIEYVARATDEEAVRALLETSSAS